MWIICFCWFLPSPNLTPNSSVCLFSHFFPPPVLINHLLLSTREVFLWFWSLLCPPWVPINRSLHLSSLLCPIGVSLRYLFLPLCWKLHPFDCFLLYLFLLYWEELLLSATLVCQKVPLRLLGRHVERDTSPLTNLLVPLGTPWINILVTMTLTPSWSFLTSSGAAVHSFCKSF